MVIFQSQCDTLLHYAQATNLGLLVKIWNGLAKAGNENLWPTLEDARESTICCLGLDLNVITHIVVEIAKDINFYTHD